jgi:hypothetical protein
MYDNNQVFNVLSLLQEHTRGCCKVLTMVLCFLLGEGRNTQYFLNIQEGDMSVYLSPVLESYRN